MPANYLNVGSKLVMIYGALVVAFGMIVPIVAHLRFPTSFVFVREDEVFTGVSWAFLLATSEQLGLWIVYLADTGRGMMAGLGILTSAIAMRGLKNGEKWAMISVFLSGLAGGIPLWTITAVYFNTGLYMGASGVSLGIWLTILLYAPWAAGLILVAKGRRQNR